MLQLPALGENQEKAAWKYLGNNQRKCDACTCWTYPQNGQGGCMGWGLLLSGMFGTTSMELSAVC